MVGGGGETDGRAHHATLTLQAHGRASPIDDVHQRERRLERTVTAVQDDVDRLVAGRVQRDDLRGDVGGQHVIEAAGHEDDAALEQPFLQPVGRRRHASLTPADGGTSTR
jgi:hypothetical protein